MRTTYRAHLTLLDHINIMLLLKPSWLMIWKAVSQIL